MVHHEGMPIPQMRVVETPPPAPRMTMAERLQRRLDADKGGAVEAQPTASSPEDDRVAALIRGVNEKTAARAAEVPAAEAAPASPEAAVEGAAEVSPEVDERAEYAKLMREHALRVREKKIADQKRIAEERARLQQLPAAPIANPTMRTVERQPAPMPSVDQFQKISIPGFGEGMILSVDRDSRTMYFATPEERRRVDAMLAKDEGQSSMGAADFRNVIALTPDQVRQYMAASSTLEAAPAESVSLEEAPRQVPVRHLGSRYAA